LKVIGFGMAVDADQAGSGSTGGSSSGSLDARFDIRADQPLKHLDSPPALAYSCTQKRDPSRELFALVCDPKQPPRHDQVSTIRRINQKGMIRVVDWGVVDWPMEGRRCPALIYERPRGGRILGTLENEIAPMSEEAVARNFIVPVTDVLRDLVRQGLTHRAIRPTNVFYDSASTAQATLVLGESLASPPALNQSAVYETVESAMAPPTGRGPGLIANDLYSVGVTALALLIGKSPCAGMSDEQVIEAKLSYGSYGALVQRNRISLTMMEIIRGLLMDEVDERWSVDDLEFWVSGRRLSPKQQAMPAKAARAFSFEGQEILTCRGVALEFGKHWDASVEPVRGGLLDTWLRRSLGDEEAIDAVNTAKAAVSVTGTENDDRLLARVMIALDPDAPIRFKSFSATIDGLGGEIYAKFTNENVRQDFAEVVRANLVAFACEMLGKSGADKMRYISQIDKMMPFLEHSEIGQGIERVIYELNPSLPCQSPLLETEYVYDMSEMLDAYERLAKDNPDGMGVLVDRHVAAFVATRLKGGLVAELRDLENRLDPASVAVANIRVLGHVQEQAGSKPAPHLCGVAVALLEPAIERFHSRKQREQMQQKLNRVAKDGLLAQILMVVDNSQNIDNDRSAYQKAVKEFVRSVLQMQQLSFEKAHRAQLSRALGAEVGAFISLVLSLIAIVVMGAFWIFGM
jgi:hypothetical protein